MNSRPAAAFFPVALPLASACGGAAPAPAVTPQETSATSASSTPPAAAGVPTEELQRTLRQSFGKFRTCYEAGLKSNPKLAGEVLVKLTIDKSGKIASATADDASTLADPTVRTCIAETVKAAALPDGAYSGVSATYPISFAPAGDKKDPSILVGTITATKQ